VTDADVRTLAAENAVLRVALGRVRALVAFWSNQTNNEWMPVDDVRRALPYGDFPC
jgi:hypothetical protein